MDHAQEVPAVAGVGDAEVPEKAKRRRFDAAYKSRILEEADRSTGPGELGELLSREGLYSSHLTCWRRQREEGSLAGLAPKRRGRKAAKNNAKNQNALKPPLTETVTRGTLAVSTEFAVLGELVG